MRVCIIAIIFCLPVPIAAFAQPADSAADFSASQGDGNWFYGLYRQGTVGGQPHGYTAGSFVELDEFDVDGQRWVASDALVGAQNNDFLNLSAEGGHPTGLGPGDQDEIIWAVRRYVMPTAGTARIAVDLRKDNVENPRGGGITGRLFVDGSEIFTQLIENADGTGVRRTFFESVQAGSVIDLAIDPSGMTPLDGSDNIFSARADASVFAARIQLVPEPAAWLLLVAAVAAASAARAV